MARRKKAKLKEGWAEPRRHSICSRLSVETKDSESRYLLGIDLNEFKTLENLWYSNGTFLNYSDDEAPVSRTAQQYGGATTIHGIPYILDKDRHPLEKLLWIIFVSIGVSLIIYLSESIWSDYKKNPVITSVETTGYNIENIDFPAVTICAQGSMQKVTGRGNKLKVLL